MYVLKNFETKIVIYFCLFQCVNVSARDVVEDLKALKQGRFKNGDKSPLISPSGRKNFESQSSPRIHAQLENSKDETSSTSSDKHEKDVNVLNRFELTIYNSVILVQINYL